MSKLSLTELQAFNTVKNEFNKLIDTYGTDFSLTKDINTGRLWLGSKILPGSFFEVTNYKTVNGRVEVLVRRVPGSPHSNAEGSFYGTIDSVLTHIRDWLRILNNIKKIIDDDTAEDERRKFYKNYSPGFDDDNQSFDQSSKVYLMHFTRYLLGAVEQSDTFDRADKSEFRLAMGKLEAQIESGSKINVLIAIQKTMQWIGDRNIELLQHLKEELPKILVEKVASEGVSLITQNWQIIMAWLMKIILGS